MTKKTYQIGSLLTKLLLMLLNGNLCDKLVMLRPPKKQVDHKLKIKPSPTTVLINIVP